VRESFLEKLGQFSPKSGSVFLASSCATFDCFDALVVLRFHRVETLVGFGFRLVQPSRQPHKAGGEYGGDWALGGDNVEDVSGGDGHFSRRKMLMAE
jgi:hypothetical protein